MSRAVLAALVLIAGCQGDEDEGRTVGPLGRDYFGIAWLESGIVVNYEPDPNNLSNDLWRLTDDGELERLDIPDLADCRLTVLRHPTALTSDALAFVRECVPVVVGGSRYDIAKLTDNGEVEPLGDLPAPVTQFAWLEPQARGLAAIGSQICHTLAWFGPDGSEPVDLVIGAGDASFNLAEQYEGVGTADCPTMGRANWPAASADSTQVAFFASPAAAGFAGQDRLDLPWDLYLLDLETMAPSLLLADVSNPRALRWAPDDDRLVFSGDIAGHGDGTWLIRVSDPEPRRLLADRLDRMAWSPDGTSVAGVLNTRVTGGPREANIVVIDVEAAGQ